MEKLFDYRPKSKYTIPNNTHLDFEGRIHRWREAFGSVLDQENLQFSEISIRNENNWNEAGKPYFNVFHDVVDELIDHNIEEKVISEIDIPGNFEAALIRLCRPNHLLSLSENAFVETILFSRTEKYFCLAISLNTDTTFLPFIGISDKSIEESLSNFGLSPVDNLCKLCFRLVINLGVIRNSPVSDFEKQLFEFDVLAADREKFRKGDGATKDKLIDKARRKKKIGWNFGVCGSLTPIDDQSPTEGSADRTGGKHSYSHVRKKHPKTVRDGFTENWRIDALILEKITTRCIL